MNYSNEELPSEWIEVAQKVCRETAPKFKFGPFTKEDMIQEALLECVKLLRRGKYDPTRPLENLLRVHVKRRMINFIRDHYSRNESPCKVCPFAVANRIKELKLELRKVAPSNTLGSEQLCIELKDLKKKELVEPCLEHGANKLECDIFAEWYKKDLVKKNIMSPANLDTLENFLSQDKTQGSELMDYIDRNLDFSLREDYLKFLADVKLKRDQYEPLMANLKELVERYNQDNQTIENDSELGDFTCV